MSYRRADSRADFDLAALRMVVPPRAGWPWGRPAEPACATDARGHHSAPRSAEPPIAPRTGARGTQSEREPRAQGSPRLMGPPRAGVGRLRLASVLAPRATLRRWPHAGQQPEDRLLPTDPDSLNGGARPGEREEGHPTRSSYGHGYWLRRSKASSSKPRPTDRPRHRHPLRRDDKRTRKSRSSVWSVRAKAAHDPRPRHHRDRPPARGVLYFAPPTQRAPPSE